MTCPFQIVPAIHTECSALHLASRVCGHSNHVAVWSSSSEKHSLRSRNMYMWIRLLSPWCSIWSGPPRSANVCCLGGLQHHLMDCVRHNKVCVSTLNVLLYLCRDQHGHPSCFWDRCIDERQVSILVPDGHQICHDDNRISGVQIVNLTFLLYLIQH